MSLEALTPGFMEKERVINQRMFTNANSQTITVLGYQPESGTIKQATGSGSVGRKILPILPAKTEHRWVFLVPLFKCSANTDVIWSSSA